MADEHEPQFAGRFPGLERERRLQLLQVGGRFLRFAQAETNEFCASIATGLLPKAGPARKIRSVPGFAGRAYDHKHGGPIDRLRCLGENGGEQRGKHEKE